MDRMEERDGPRETVDTDEHRASNNLLGHDVLHASTSEEVRVVERGWEYSTELVLEEGELEGEGSLGTRIGRSSESSRDAVDGRRQLR